MPKVLRPGENQAVDIEVVDPDGFVLLIGRSSGEWALPGGMVEAGESDVDAMVRELFEETDVAVDRADVRIVSDRLPVDDPRNTATSWITTVVGVVRPHVRPDVRAG